MTTTETPAAQLRAAAKLMRERAEKATPGPWERPLDVRHKNYVMAEMPEGEQGSWADGTIPAEFASHKGPTGRYAGRRERVGVASAAIWSIGGFLRNRSGRDLDYIASMHPLVALAVADWLEDVATDAGELLKLDTPECAHDGGDCYCRPMAPEWGCDRCGEYLTPGACTCWDKALAVARTYLGETERAVRPDSWECPKCHCLFERAGFDHEPCAHLGETDG